MIEIENFDDGPNLKAWYSEGIDAVRVVSSPGGVSLDVKQAKELGKHLLELAGEVNE